MGSHWLMIYGDAQRLKSSYSLKGAFSLYLVPYINGWDSESRDPVLRVFAESQCAQFAKLGVV